MSEPRPSRSDQLVSGAASRRLLAWAFLAVPLVGVVELIAHVAQSHGATPEKDWLAAREAVQQMAHANDLVAFAPRWVDPVGRRYFGADLATFAREGRADETRFARAIEVSIRGQHLPELSGWTRVDEKKIGAITITTLANPRPAKVIDDLLDHDGPSRMRVARVDPSGHESECGYVRGQAQAGNLGFGPAIPGNRFNCAGPGGWGGGFVGISMIADLDYRPRRCFYAPPPGGNSRLRVVFKDVVLGTVLHGHHGLYVEAERQKQGAQVTLRFTIGDRAVGTVVHNDGDGWKAFELPTDEWAGQTQDLVAEVMSPSNNRRMYCFEADTR